MRKTLPFFLLLITLLVTIFPVTAYGKEPELTSYVSTIFNERNGLPTGEANDVLQTSDGYIWIGSYGGLIRYDGTTFRNFSTEGILPSSSVRMMYEDSHGRLWIGTNDAGVFFYENQTITRPEGQPERSFLCVRGFVESSDGIIYACSNSGVAKIQDGSMTVYDHPEIAGRTVYSLAADSFGRIWCADNNGGIKVLSQDEILQTYSGPDIFGEDFSVYSITSGTDGEIWVGSNRNVVAKIEILKEGFGKDAISITQYKTGSVSTHNSVRCMKDRTLLISGQHGLGLLYADNTFYEFPESEGADSVNSAFQDYEGNIWLASSSKGIVRFSKGCYSSPNAKTGLTGTALNTIAVQSGITYVGTDSGLTVYDRNWNRVENALTEFYGDETLRVKNILSDSSGCIWIAAYDSSKTVVKYNPKTGAIQSFSPEDGLVSDRARVLLELSDHRIAVGTQNGLNILSDDKVEESYTDLPYPVILCLLETESGSLLAGSDGGGIYELKNKMVTIHGFEEGLGEGVILRMLADSEGNGYFISAGSSLYYWENHSFHKFTNLKKAAGSIFDFYQDGNTLWCLQNNGILSYDRADIMEEGTGQPILYSFAHGLTGSLNANTWHYAQDGSLYMATRNGISIFSFSAPEYPQPKGIINSITIDDTLYEHPDVLRLPSDAKRITIDFAVLSFTDTTPLAISYQLKGFEETATTLEDAKSGQISYTNLPGGKYTFEFHIIDNNHPQEQTAITLDVAKDKRFTEQPVFWVIAVVILIAVVASVVLIYADIKIKNAKSRQQEYRAILEQSLMTFAGTIDAKDPYTNGHSRRVAQYSRELARRMGFSTEQQEHIYYVALLHDIGKIGIPDHILNKPGKLTESEMAVIKTHPDIGAEILKNFTALEGIAEGAKYHHEKYDGTGYSEGRAGTDIPLLARIICVADAYDAMSSRRCYRNSLSPESIITELEHGSGTQFDPEIVPHMLAMIRENMVPFM